MQSSSANMGRNEAAWSMNDTTSGKGTFDQHGKGMCDSVSIVKPPVNI